MSSRDRMLLEEKEIRNHDFLEVEIWRSEREPYSRRHCISEGREFRERRHQVLLYSS